MKRKLWLVISLCGRDGSRFHLCSLFLLLAAATPALLGQQSYFKVETDDFVKETERIFVGRLIDRQSYRSHDGRFIFTRYRFQVRETIKGVPENMVEITEYGGTVGEETMTVSHTAGYVPNQEYLVFSYVDLLRHNRTLAGPLGQFPVVADAAGNRRIRIYAEHPLSRLLDGGKGSVFSEVTAVAARLRKAVEGVAREKK
ncbi:MAG: hypothetical protein HYX74_05710 [Acidobacteria bacterium]|nr:hypothetical protein [Acidobacteriota bacterium]